MHSEAMALAMPEPVKWIILSGFLIGAVGTLVIAKLAGSLRRHNRPREILEFSARERDRNAEWKTKRKTAD